MGWLHANSAPQLCIVGRDKEFYSTLFCDRLQSRGSQVEFTNTETPCENDRTERSGKRSKEDFPKVKEWAVPSIMDEDELPILQRSSWRE